MTSGTILSPQKKIQWTAGNEVSLLRKRCLRALKRSLNHKVALGKESAIEKYQGGHSAGTY